MVHGIIRRASTFNTTRIEHLYADPKTHREGKMKLHYGDMTDSSSLIKIISAIKPNEIYNLAAQSHVKVSFDLSEYTAEVDAVGTLRLLDAIRTCGMEGQIKFYQASTSELYGKVLECPQNEKTPFYPRSPYGLLYSFQVYIFTLGIDFFVLFYFQLVQKCMVFGFASITVKHIICLHVTVFYLIMNHRDVVKILLHEKLPVRLQKSI